MAEGCSIVLSKEIILGESNEVIAWYPSNDIAHRASKLYIVHLAGDRLAVPAPPFPPYGFSIIALIRHFLW